MHTHSYTRSYVYAHACRHLQVVVLYLAMTTLAVSAARLHPRQGRQTGLAGVGERFNKMRPKPWSSLHINAMGRGEARSVAVVLVVVWFSSLPSAKAVCDSNYGPSGSLDCFLGVPYYDGYQWGTCLSNQYIRTKSKGTPSVCQCYVLSVYFNNNNNNNNNNTKKCIVIDSRTEKILMITSAVETLLYHMTQHFFKDNTRAIFFSL